MAGRRARAVDEGGPRLRRGEGFAEGAARLAGLAGALLGWRPAEFWEATPAELAAVLGALGSDDVPADANKLLALKEMFPDG